MRRSSQFILAFTLSLAFAGLLAFAGPTTQPTTLPATQPAPSPYAQQLAAAQSRLAQAQAATAQAQADVVAVQKIIASLIPSGADLAPLIEQAHDGTTLLCTPGGSYTFGHTVQCKLNGVTIEGNGSTLACTPSPGASSSLVVYGGHFTLADFSILKANVFLRDYGPACTVTGCTFDGCTSVILTGEAGTGLLVQRCSFAKGILSVPVYITTDSSTVDSCSFAGSVGEYCLRYDFTDAGRKPVGALISNCSFVNHNAPGKDAVGFRGIDSARMTNCTIDGDVRFGGNPPLGSPAVVSATTYNAACMVDHCTFSGIADGGAAIRIYMGSTVSVTSCTFNCGANTIPISVDQMSILAATGNVQQHAAGVTIKPLIGSSSLGARMESGTTGAVVAAPATQPNH
jgi:hypothetical protein